MKIPAQYQLFASTVVIGTKDAERLSVYISGWKQLAPILSRVNERDLERLIVLELMGKKRWKLLERLIGRLSTTRRNQLVRRVRQCLK